MGTNGDISCFMIENAGSQKYEKDETKTVT